MGHPIASSCELQTRSASHDGPGSHATPAVALGAFGTTPGAHGAPFGGSSPMRHTGSPHVHRQASAPAVAPQSGVQRALYSPHVSPPTTHWTPEQRPESVSRHPPS